MRGRATRARVAERELPGHLEPAREVVGLRRAGAQEEQAVLHASLCPHGDGRRSRTRRDKREHLGDVARLETGIRADLEDGRPDHAAGDCDLAGREARGVQGKRAFAGAPREVAQGARGDGREVGVLVREDVAGGREARHDARVSPLEDRHDLVAHVGAQVARVGVRVVLTPNDAAHAQELAELVVRTVE